MPNLYKVFLSTLTVFFFVTLCFRVFAGSGGLNGSYTVGTPSSDYINLEAAIEDLELSGMAGPVTLNVEPGTYQTHVTIGEINRFNQADDWLTITSESQTAVLQHDASSTFNNWVIKIEDAAYINIKNLVLETTGTDDFNNIVVLGENSSHITIEDNIFNNYVVNALGDDDESYSINNEDNAIAANNIKIHNNVFNSGNGGVRLRGVNGFPIVDVSIKNNVFNQQHGVGSFYVVKLSSVNEFEFIANEIETDYTNAKGPYFFTVNEGVIAGNKINITNGQNGGTGLRVGQTNTGPEQKIIIKNNFIKASPIGIHVSSPFTNNIEIYHNTIVMDQFSGIDVTALDISAAAVNVNIQNNIFINRNDNMQAHIMTIDDLASVNISENNRFYGESSELFVVEGISYSNFSVYQHVASMDFNSVFDSVDFVDEAAGDLHLKPAQYNDPDLFTFPIEGVSFDIDSENRNPNIARMGADDLFYEFIFTDGFE